MKAPRPPLAGRRVRTSPPPRPHSPPTRRRPGLRPIAPRPGADPGGDMAYPRPIASKSGLAPFCRTDSPLPQCRSPSVSSPCCPAPTRPRANRTAPLGPCAFRTVLRSRVEECPGFAGARRRCGPRGPAARRGPRADRARGRVVAARRAVLAAEVDDLQVHARPSASGNSPLRSRSVSATFVPDDSPQRAARRWMCVSTGNAGSPNACAITTLAVLCPTPGSASSSSKVARHLRPPWRSTRSCDSAPDVLRLGAAQSPHGRMMRSISGDRERAPSPRASRARAKSGGVTSLTRTSVHCAESTTATRRVNGSSWPSGMGGAG